MLENFVVKHKVKYLDIAGDWQYVCVCVESGGEFDFGILINIATKRCRQQKSAHDGATRGRTGAQQLR